MQTESDSSSIHELLELFKHFKSGANDTRSKDLSALSFSSRNFESAHRHPLESISIENIPNLHSRTNTTASSNKPNIFSKLYHEGRELQQRKYMLEYETRRSKEEKQRSECTFSPNIRSRFRTRPDDDSMEAGDSFYLKNMQWQERKDRSIRKMQCEKNEEQTNSFTFTPRINKCKKNKADVSKANIQNKVVNAKGVSDFLQRQEKAKKNQQYIKQKQKNPYSHVWNVKRGYFSYVK